MSTRKQDPTIGLFVHARVPRPRRLPYDRPEYGDAMFDLTDGEKVPITAKQIIADSNMCLCGVSYPGVTSTIVPHNEVVFTP